MRSLIDFLPHNESGYCWQQQWRYLGDHIPPPSPGLLISLVNLITVLSPRLPFLKETAPTFSSQLSSFASDPFLKKMKLHLLGICTWRGEGTLCSVSVLAHAWLGKGRLCVTFNEVKVLSERGCYRETRVESPVDCFFAVSAEVKNEEKKQLLQITMAEWNSLESTFLPIRDSAVDSVLCHRAYFSLF